MKELNRYNRDEAIWYAHKVVCAYYDAGVKPTVANLRENWKSANYAELTDDELAIIIANASKYYRI